MQHHTWLPHGELDMFEMPLRPFGFFQPKYKAEIHLDTSYCEEVSALHGDSKDATGLAVSERFWFEKWQEMSQIPDGPNS